MGPFRRRTSAGVRLTGFRGPSPPGRLRPGRAPPPWVARISDGFRPVLRSPRGSVHNAAFPFVPRKGGGERSPRLAGLSEALRSEDGEG